MRVFREPVKQIFTGPKLKKPDATVTPQEDERKAAKAADEAARKARSALARQEKGGRAATLIGAMQAQSDIQTQRRTLGGA